MDIFSLLIGVVVGVVLTAVIFFGVGLALYFDEEYKRQSRFR